LIVTTQESVVAVVNVRVEGDTFLRNVLVSQNYMALQHRGLQRVAFFISTAANGKKGKAIPVTGREVP
jgi:hypothetical protein